jgi:hypothetical protein
MNTRSVVTWFLSLALGPCSVTYACSCRPGATLEQHYEQAENILIARISACAPAKLSGDGNCRRHGWTFDTIEDLKGSRVSVQVRPSDAGLAVSTCDLPLKVGDTYLLFLRDGRTDQCSGTRRLDHEFAVGEIGILRAYRDGAITRVTNPWHFSDNGWMCTIKHQLRDVSMTFNFQYAQSQVGLEQGAGALSRPILNMTLLPTGTFDFAGPTVLEVDGDPVPLKRITGRLPRSVDIVTGDAVIGLLDTMSQSEEVIEVVVSGERTTTGGRVEPFRATTRTAQIQEAALRFKACIEAQ